MSQAASPSCLECKYFNHAPADLEAALPGLSSLSSAYAAVRCDDGICAVHQRYVTASSVCPAFAYPVSRIRSMKLSHCAS
jgi:hypothetical protein